jgi:hypothetical protein
MNCSRGRDHVICYLPPQCNRGFQIREALSTATWSCDGHSERLFSKISARCLFRRKDFTLDREVSVLDFGKNRSLRKQNRNNR